MNAASRYAVQCCLWLTVVLRTQVHELFTSGNSHEIIFSYSFLPKESVQTTTVNAKLVYKSLLGIGNLTDICIQIERRNTFPLFLAVLV